MVRDRPQVFTLRADGTDPRHVAPPNWSASPDWSPDGRRLVFDRSNGANPSTVHLAQGDGTGSRLLVQSAGRPHDPVWSPDGRTILFWLAVVGTPGASRRPGCIW
jgi:Tol biopolymer transport system component